MAKKKEEERSVIGLFGTIENRRRGKKKGKDKRRSEATRRKKICKTTILPK